MLLCTATTWARPGYSKPVDVKQPDGTTITLLMRGDEFLSFMTTTDGYTVIKGSDGYYRYAELQDSGLKATAFVARNPEARQQNELSFLASQKKNIHPEMSEKAKEWKANAAQMCAYAYKPQLDGRRRAANIWDRINYSNFKGLVVLVNWNDRKFTMDNPQAFYQKLTSEKNLVDKTHSHYPVDINGSVRDYFYDNSMGIFDPTFDVVGPVDIDFSCTYPEPKDENGNEKAGFYNRFIEISSAALDKVNATVDFKDYDLNSDGVIDMVYFIFAGYGSYVQGNDYHLLWPHAQDMTSYSKWYGWRYDGKYVGRYACSVEIQDSQDYAEFRAWLDGIGTMCHEFSHVLGLADHYDTDYSDNGQADDPGVWDVMAGGADQNYGLTPVGYNAFERYILGFADDGIQTLDVAGDNQLEPFNTGNKFFLLKTGTKDDDFYIENRQKQGWDAFLPGHGMLVWRAETSNASVWSDNKVNNNANHMYFQLLKARPEKAMSSGYTPFPGLGNVTDLTSTSTPALLSWAGKEADMDLYDITENEDGTITFHAGKNLYESALEDFEAMAVTTADATEQPGVFCNWNLAKATIEQVADNLGNGLHVVKLQRNGTLTSSPLTRSIRNMSFKVWNGSQKIRLSVKYSTDGTSWTTLTSIDGKQTIELAKNNTATLTYSTAISVGAQLQISMLGTSDKAVTYIDDIQVSLGNETTGISQHAISNQMSGAAYNLSGQKVSDSYKGLTIRNGKKSIKQ